MTVTTGKCTRCRTSHNQLINAQGVCRSCSCVSAHECFGCNTTLAFDNWTDFCSDCTAKPAEENAMTNKELHTQFQENFWQEAPTSIWYTEKAIYRSFDSNKKKQWSYAKYDGYGYSWVIFYARAKGMTYNEYLREKNN